MSKENPHSTYRKDGSCDDCGSYHAVKLEFDRIHPSHKLERIKFGWVGQCTLCRYGWIDEYMSSQLVAPCAVLLTKQGVRDLGGNGRKVPQERAPLCAGRSCEYRYRGSVQHKTKPWQSVSKFVCKHCHRAIYCRLGEEPI